MDLKEQLDEDNYELNKSKNMTIVSSIESFEAETRAEVDMQVATAKKYPRNLRQVLNNIEYLATQDQETAESCFYALKRDGKTITGATVRLAEIITSCWGNIRSQAKIIANDGKFITAQGTCWDLETNVAYSIEVRRKITDKTGKTYTEDMQIVSANAICSVALRNAVFKVIPMAITRKIQDKIKDVILGDEESFDDVKQKAVEYFIGKGVTKAQILKFVGRESIEGIDREDVVILRGVATAIEDGDTTIASAFNQNNKYRAKGIGNMIDFTDDDEPDTDENEVVIVNEVPLTESATSDISEKSAKSKRTTKKK